MNFLILLCRKFVKLSLSPFFIFINGYDNITLPNAYSFKILKIQRGNRTNRFVWFSSFDRRLTSRGKQPKSSTSYSFPCPGSVMCTQKPFPFHNAFFSSARENRVNIKFSGASILLLRFDVFEYMHFWKNVCKRCFWSFKNALFVTNQISFFSILCVNTFFL